MVDKTTDDESPNKSALVMRWLSDIDAAKKREKQYRKDGEKVLDIYGCDDESRVPFNILYSNTETLYPVLYSAVPRPVVTRRFRDDDPAGLAAAKAGTRVLEYLIDQGVDGYETFGQAIGAAVMDALLPGRGVTLIKYDAEISEYLEPGADGTKAHEAAEGEKPDDGNEEDGTDNGELAQQKESETICIDSVQWDRVVFGFARKWSDVPWIALEVVIDKDEAVRLFGKQTANKIRFVKDGDKPDSDEDAATNDNNDESQGSRKTAVVYQIWDKDGGRKVRYVSRHYTDDFLKVDDDPLELTGFYPMPMPMQFNRRPGDLTPFSPYKTYEKQAKELNLLTTRIMGIEAVLQAKGIYDPELGSDIERLVSAEDNTLIPADKASALSAEKGLQNAIWMWPVEKLIGVLRELYASREQCKQVIYEITGMSDIMRGASVASETATAQNIKNQWGTLRIKKSQAEVQRYARDLLRIMLEIAATNFSEETWAKMTGLPYASEMEVQQANAVMQMAQQYLAQQQAQQPQEQGQQTPQIPPQYQQIYAQAQSTLQKPKWSDVLTLLKDDMQRAYRIDIETNSTLAPEASEDQRNMAEVMTGLGQAVQGLTPMVQQGFLPFEAAQAMVLGVVRRYQLGDEVEDKIKEMKAPPPPQQPPAPPDHTLEIKQMEMQAKQAELAANAEMEKQKMAIDAQVRQAELAAQQAIETAKIEAQRLVEQGKASTEIYIEELRIAAQKEINGHTEAENMRRHVLSINAARDPEDMEELDEYGNPIPKPAIAAVMGDLLGGINTLAQVQQAQAEMLQAMLTAQQESLAAALQTIAQAQADSIAAMTAQQADGFTMLATQMTRPKQVVRGADGMVVGIQ